MRQQKQRYWRRLDNAAKLFAAMSSKKDTRVIRFYSELNEEIQGDKLQEALDRTLLKYPIFLSVMRKGLFWHYLEKSSLRPEVKEEYRAPCSSLYIHDKKTLLFEVTYYKNRINFEAYHVLTDGTGATEFIRELTKNYLLAAHAGEGLPDVSLTEQDVTGADHESDGFLKYYTEDLKPEKKEKRHAYQIRGTSEDGDSLHLTEMDVPFTALKKRAKELGVSVTVFVTAAFLCAIQKEMTRRQKRKPVALMVMVNLRKFFPSDSMLNFFSKIEPAYQFGEGKDSFAETLASVKAYFARELTAENMARRMNEYIALEMHPFLRFVPLELKNLFIHAGVKTSSGSTTAVLSNMGSVEMPAEYLPYIRRFGAYTGTLKMELCILSFQERMTFAFTSRYDTTNIRRNFRRILEGEGISPVPLEEEFPEQVQEDFTAAKAFKLFTFLCIALAVAALCSDYLMEGPMHISFLVSGGIASFWVFLTTGYLKRYNLLKNASWQQLLITAGCVLWDLFTGWRGWSVDYVIPIATVVVLAAMVNIIWVKKLPPREYMIYLVMASGYGIILPLILLLTGIVTFRAPTVLCVAFCFLFILGLVFFRHRELKDEMAKKLHF